MVWKEDPTSLGHPSFNNLMAVARSLAVTRWISSGKASGRGGGKAPGRGCRESHSNPGLGRVRHFKGPSPIPPGS